MNETKLLNALKNNPFVLSPMAAITDHAFRSFMREQGAGILVTELVSASGLVFASEKTRSLMSFGSDQHPIGIQLFGEDPQTLAKAAVIAEETGVDFIDLNFGCPVPKVVKKGGGSAMLRDLEQLKKVLNAVRSAIKIPLTIKIRTGWDAFSRNAEKVCEIAYQEGICWVAIHGRTRAQSYSGVADWEYIKQVKTQAKIPVLGNGDIHTAEQALDRLNTSGCDGVLIGRACLKNPAIFAQSMALWTEKNLGMPSRKPNLEMAASFSRLVYHLQKHCPENLQGIQIKKFAAWYSSGYSGASLFRKNIFQTKSIQESIELANGFFAQISVTDQKDTSAEAFLMGGHG